jgi:hypothetical protein
MIDLLTRSPPGTAVEFLRKWHGGESPASARADQDIPLFVPRPLREFYVAVQNWPDAVVQNRLLDPTELRLEDGRLLFYVENQAVYLWATSPSADDPPVWGRENVPDASWEKEGEQLSRFLVQLAVFEAVMGADVHASAAWLDPESLGRVLTDLVELPFAPWRWPDHPTRFFGREGVLAVVAPNRTPESSDYVSIYVGAKSESALSFLETHIDDAWDIYTPWD